MSRLDRFKHLETRRTERGGDDDAGKKTEERFARVEKEQAPDRAPSPANRPAAQRVARQVSDQPLALETRSKEEQQFIRCMGCEADNSRYAQSCVHCGSALWTDEVRDYNEKFWRQRQTEVAQEKQEVEQIHARKEQHTKEQAEAKAAAFTAMVKEAQRGSDSGEAPGIRIIQSIDSSSGRVMAIAGFILLGVISFACLGKYQPGRTWLGVTGLLGLLALAILFLPPSVWARRSRNHWWDDW
ncbi:MAG TPA: hypothetical protein VIG99_12825 [Myxococcaceae bacterium]|jgi:ribosomal protein L40E